MRAWSLRYAAVVVLGSCSLVKCPTPVPEPDICVATRGINGHGDLVTATPPPPGTTACEGATPVTGKLTSTHGTDVSRTGLCSLTGDPYAELTNDDDSVRVCMFYSCNPGTTGVTDCYETKPGDSRGSNDGSAKSNREKTHVVKGVTESGFTGCCRTGKGRVAAKVQCSGIFAAKVESYLWIESTDGGDHSYSVTYGM